MVSYRLCEGPHNVERRVPMLPYSRGWPSEVVEAQPLDLPHGLWTAPADDLLAHL